MTGDRVPSPPASGRSATKDGRDGEPYPCCARIPHHFHRQTRMWEGGCKMERSNVRARRSISSPLAIFTRARRTSKDSICAGVLCTTLHRIWFPVLARRSGVHHTPHTFQPFSDRTYLTVPRSAIRSSRRCCTDRMVRSIDRIGLIQIRTCVLLGLEVQCRWRVMRGGKDLDVFKRSVGSCRTQPFQFVAVDEPALILVGLSEMCHGFTSLGLWRTGIVWY